VDLDEFNPDPESAKILDPMQIRIHNKDKFLKIKILSQKYYVGTFSYL
jgi:hypothetical protein